jgi:hypothetical protein
MLVDQFVVLNFVDDSHGHVFIVNTIMDAGFRRSSRVIHEEIILTGPNAFKLSVGSTLIMLTYHLYHAATRGEIRSSIVSLTPSHIVKAIREQRMRPSASGSVRVFFPVRNKYHANGLVIQENPSIIQS